MSSPAWDTERAAHLAREAYRYVARTFPPDAPLEPLGRADMAVLEPQEACRFSPEGEGGPIADAQMCCF